MCFEYTRISKYMAATRIHCFMSKENHSIGHYRIKFPIIDLQTSPQKTDSHLHIVTLDCRPADWIAVSNFHVFILVLNYVIKLIYRQLEVKLYGGGG